MLRFVTNFSVPECWIDGMKARKDVYADFAYGNFLYPLSHLACIKQLDYSTKEKCQRKCKGRHPAFLTQNGSATSCAQITWVVYIRKNRDYVLLHWPSHELSIRIIWNFCIILNLSFLQRGWSFSFEIYLTILPRLLKFHLDK